MIVSILQLDTRWLDPVSNLQIVEKACTELTKETKLLVLPEMFSSGYLMDPRVLKTDEQDMILDKLRELAATYHITICGSIPMYKSGKWFNTCIVMGESGLLHEYDKIHLFSLAGEDLHYSAGNSCRTFEMDGWAVQTLICYDVRFPNVSFTDDIPDLLIYTANWPEQRIHQWHALLTARAIENQCYVLGVNRIGQDENKYKYSGQSMCIDYRGKSLLTMDEKEQLATIYLDLEGLQTYRRQLPFLKDRKCNEKFVIG